MHRFILLPRLAGAAISNTTSSVFRYSYERPRNRIASGSPDCYDKVLEFPKSVQSVPTFLPANFLFLLIWLVVHGIRGIAAVWGMFLPSALGQKRDQCGRPLGCGAGAYKRQQLRASVLVHACPAREPELVAFGGSGRRHAVLRAQAACRVSRCFASAGRYQKTVKRTAGRSGPWRGVPTIRLPNYSEL